MEISLEIVPRSSEALKYAEGLARSYPEISAINIPDLLRFPLRSWDACRILSKESAGGRFLDIPHLRAIDFDPLKPFPHRELFREIGIRNVLAVAGDPSSDNTIRAYPVETVEFIRRLKSEMPELTVYAAFDPYRNNIKFEVDYLRQKLDAGADGFMSQPFFDLRLLEIYAEYLEGQKVYWGISPVISDKSRDYWERNNRAIFPRSFSATLDWNVRFGRDVKAFCERKGFDLYLMPIKVELEAYLSGLFC